MKHVHYLNKELAKIKKASYLAKKAKWDMFSNIVYIPNKELVRYLTSPKINQ